MLISRFNALLNQLRINSTLRFIHLSPLTSFPKLPQAEPLNESDLVEDFVRGSGPGGQAINSKLLLDEY